MNKTEELSDETLGKVAGALDLGETLFEETIADAKRKLGGAYPDGDKARQAAAEVLYDLS